MSIQLALNTKELLHVAELAKKYIDSKIETTEHGIRYSLEGSANSDPYFDDVSLYSGSAGIIHYLLQLYAVTQEPAYLEQAEASYPYLDYRFHNSPELSLAFSPWAFTSGFAGVAYAVSELYKVTGKAEYKAFVEEVVEAIIAAAKPAEDGVGAYWSGSFGVVADSGTFLFLLHAAEQFNRKDWLDFTLNAGRVLIGQAKPYEKGGNYFAGSQFGDNIIPGYPIGAGGVAYTLWKLYDASGDETFRDATDGVATFYRAIYLKDEQGFIKIPHAIGEEHPVYYLGYCGGNAGVARYFYKLYEETSQQEYLDEASLLLDSIIAAGAPEVHSAGYWNTVAQCCGSSSILNSFLGQYLATGDERFLDYSKRTAEQLLGDAHHDFEEDGTETVRWYEAYTRLEPDNITAPIGFYEGAAGAGSALLSLYSVLKDKPAIPRSVDDPFPVKKLG
ncbi:lanthionine synthetase LanC family protein [Lacticaseibacillus sp. GG6-2]